MVRKSKERSDIIKWRSHEPNRLETFSDAVFAFAVTLVIVSLEVPKSFDELREMMLGFPSFALCFWLLFYLWNLQNVFFRRYGLRDNYTTVLNALLLLTVLCYVYPLKFLFNLALGTGGYKIEARQGPDLMLLYDTGYFVILVLFYLMYSRAHQKRGEIGLSPKEVYQTNSLRFGFLLSTAVPLISLFVAYQLPPNRAALSAMLYFLFFPLLTIWHGVRGRRIRQLFD